MFGLTVGVSTARSVSNITRCVLAFTLAISACSAQVVIGRDAADGGALVADAGDEAALLPDGALVDGAAPLLDGEAPLTDAAPPCAECDF